MLHGCCIDSESAPKSAPALPFSAYHAQYGRTPLYRMFRDEKDPGRKYGIFRLRSYEPRFDLAYAMYRFLKKDFNWSMTMSPKGLHFNDGTFFNSFYRGFQTLTGCTYTERSDQMNESPDCNVENSEIQRKSREFIEASL